MIVEEIVKILESDDKLTTLLDSAVEDSYIYPFAVEKDHDCICFNLEPQSCEDGIVEEYKLTLTVLSKDYIKSNLLMTTSTKALCTFGDELKTENILNISRVAGGGCYENNETHTIYNKAYFSVTNILE